MMLKKCVENMIGRFEDSSREKRIPISLEPAGKAYLWGGNRLKENYQKNCQISPLAETWECSTHSEGLSVVKDGEYKGKTLKEVLRQHPDYLGTAHANEHELPILVKMIDAAEKLSIQVHPDDFYAQKYENEDFGKAEMWYVL